MDLDAAIVSDLAAEELASFIGEGSGAAAPRRTLPDMCVGAVVRGGASGWPRGVLGTKRALRRARAGPPGR